MAECATYFTPALWIAAPFQCMIRLLALVSMQLHEWISDPLIWSLLIWDPLLAFDLAVWTEEFIARAMMTSFMNAASLRICWRTCCCKHIYVNIVMSLFRHILCMCIREGGGGLSGKLHLFLRQHSINSNLMAHSISSCAFLQNTNRPTLF